MTSASRPRSSSSRTTASIWSSPSPRAQKTGVKSIEFVGNSAYSSYRLKDVIKTRESNLLSFLGGNDVYDPDRVEADRDLIRRFYLKNGFADVQVVAALTEYDPERKGFLVTFKIEEGQQYRVGSVDFQSTHPDVRRQCAARLSRVNVGSLYNVEAVEKSVEEMQIEASRRGYAFAVVRPRGDRNFDAHTVSVVFAVDEGPRIYIERINVRGNTRTRDFVIRREFDISEGDAYNRALVDRAERRLKNLDFFKSVKITTEPGSSSDRVVLIVDLEEKSTGDFSVSGGYSTTDGALAEVSISERNFLGRGLFAKASVTYGQYARGYSLSFVEPYLLDYRVALGSRRLSAPATGQQLHLLRHEDAGLQPAARLPAPRGSVAAAALFDLPAGNHAAVTLTNCNNTSWQSDAARLQPDAGLRESRTASDGAHAATTPRASACGATATAKPRCRSARNWRAARR